MHLTLDLVPAFVDFLAPERREDERASRRSALLQSIKAGTRDPMLTRLLLDPDQRIRAALVTLPIGENIHQLFHLMFAPELPEQQKPEALPLLNELVEVAQSRGVRCFESRLEATHLFPGYEQHLRKLGFAQIGERIEFKGPLSALPDELGSPLTWEPASDIGFAAELLGRVGPGAPDWLESDDPAQLMIDYFSDPSLTSGLDCVHVGRLDGQLAALVIAQVSLSDAWSRLTYMGLVPELRGRGLGRWVHRHGFEMMRQQGGQTYHGGCAMTNHAMRKLFENHGIPEKRRLTEWQLKLTPGHGTPARSSDQRK